MSALGVRFTSGVIPADHLVASMAAKPFRSMYLHMYELWWGSSPGSSRRVPHSMRYDRRSTDQYRIVWMVILKLVYKISLRNVHLINTFALYRMTTSSDLRHVSEDILRLQKKETIQSKKSKLTITVPSQRTDFHCLHRKGVS